MGNMPEVEAAPVFTPCRMCAVEMAEPEPPWVVKALEMSPPRLMLPYSAVVMKSHHTDIKTEQCNTFRM